MCLNLAVVIYWIMNSLKSTNTNTLEGIPYNIQFTCFFALSLIADVFVVVVGGLLVVGD